MFYVFFWAVVEEHLLSETLRKDQSEGIIHTHHWHGIQNSTGAFNELPKKLQERSEQFAALHQNAIRAMTGLTSHFTLSQISISRVREFKLLVIEGEKCKCYDWTRSASLTMSPNVNGLFLFL